MAPSAATSEVSLSHLNNNGVTNIAEMQDLRTSMLLKHAFPMWKVENTYAKNRPHGHAVPKIWNFPDIKKDLLKSASLVPATQSQRRVAMLVNPAFDPETKAYTTDTIYAGYQLILPGEIASAHRHVAFAMRFGIEGDETYTSVAGEKLRLGAGDLIVTPSWEWHYHGNDGNKPGIWLDSLDVPLATFAKVNFLDVYPTAKVPDRKFKFPWTATKNLLDAQEGAHATHHFKYKDLSGVSKTLGAQAERISAGTSTQPKCETFSFVYSPKSGTGYSTIVAERVGEDTRKPVVIRWKPKDVFAVPSWSHVVHTADPGEDAYLFAFNDRPQLENLGLNRVLCEDNSIKLAPNV